MSTISRFLENRLTDGSEIVSLTRRPRFNPQKYSLVLISVRGWVNPRVIVLLEWLGNLKIFSDLIGNEPATFWLVRWCHNQNFRYFEKRERKEKKVVLHDHHTVSPLNQLLNWWTSRYETWYIYILSPELISAAYFIDRSHQSVAVCTSIALLWLQTRGWIKCKTATR
jgi:hypothetical protein